MKHTPRRTVFTICSRNYLHYAITLMRSVRDHGGDVDRFIFLCDRAGGCPSLPGEVAKVCGMEILPIDNLDDLISKYTVIELNTAIKPACFLYLLRELGYTQATYFDPDIRLYDSMSRLHSELESADMLLTPHICAPIDDDDFPGEQVFLQTGIYNLGFLALNATDETERLLSWWDARLRDHCVIDLPNGYFVDQKWMDYAPSFITRARIIHDPGWNVAYWNLPHRNLTFRDGGVLVNDSPLFFFHFSGLAVKGNVLSKHQDRFSITDLGKPGRTLIADYRDAIHANGLETYRPIPYGFDTFPSGRAIPSFFHHLYREDPVVARKLGPLHATGNEEKWINFALEVPSGHHLLNRAALHVYHSRPDLLNAFPELRSGEEYGFAVWFVENAETQSGVDPLFVNDVRTRLRPPSWRSHPAGWLAGAFRSACSRVFRMVYKLGFRLYPLLSRFTSVRTRNRLHLLIKRLAFSPGRTPTRGRLDPRHPPGVNLIGYLKAESGVGKAARLSLEALRSQSEFPVSTRAVSIGCLSRENESTPEKTSPDGDLPFAVNLFQVNADMTAPVLQELGTRRLNGRFNIGYWYWELPEFPQSWRSAFDPYHEIWVASTFCQRAIAPHSTIPVTVMPPPVTVNPDPAFNRSHFGLPRDRPLFLCMADGLSFLERKNPLGAYQAFRTAFPEPESSPASLVLKVVNLAKASPQIREQLREISEAPDVILIDRYLDAREVDSLTNICDAMISLHRSEGFGLPIAEAMRLGKPVIATGWSSNMDFMTPFNSLPVDVDVVELDRDFGPYQKGMHWAEPSIEHAAEHIRWCVQTPHAAAALGERARKTISNSYSPEAAGQRMRERIAYLLQVNAESK